MQTYTLEIQDDVLPQVLAMLQNSFTKGVKIKPQPINEPLEKIEQKADLDLNEDFDQLSSLDYLTISEDKTDEKWLKNLFSLMDVANANPVVALENSAEGLDTGRNL